MSNNIEYVNGERLKELLKERGTPVIVDFFSDDCPPCDVLAPIYQKMADKYEGLIRFVKIKRQQNRETALELGVTSSPTVLFFLEGKEVGHRLNGFMTKPQVRLAIEEILGEVLPPEETKRVDCDLLVLGAGPAGLTAGIYAGRSKLDTVILDESVSGGQIATTSHVANYPGTREAVNGKDLAADMAAQALSFGVRLDDLKEVFEIRLAGTDKVVRTEDTEYHAKAIILATGARPRPLDATGAEELKGRGVHYCATCDGAMYEDADVVVVGGGSAAIEEAVFLTRFAHKVTIVHRREEFRAARSELEEAMANKKIAFQTNKVIREVVPGQHVLQEVILSDVKTGKETVLPAAGVFVYVGNDPQTQLFRDQISLDEQGYIAAGEDTITSLPGVFAAGDVRAKGVRQVATAVSDGAVAAVMAEKFIASQG